MQRACSVLFSTDTTRVKYDPSCEALAPGISDTHASTDVAQTSADPLPLFEQTRVQALAVGKKFQSLADAVRSEILTGHCPVCRYKCNDKAYITGTSESSDNE